MSEEQAEYKVTQSLPWVQYTRDGKLNIANNSGLNVANDVIMRDDAKYVVEACNAYPGLVKRVQELEEALAEMHEDLCYMRSIEVEETINDVIATMAKLLKKEG